MNAAEMELLPEGKNFRLAKEDELPEILEFLSNFLPDSLKVRFMRHATCSLVVNRLYAKQAERMGLV